MTDEFEDDDFIFANDDFTIFRLIKDNGVTDDNDDDDDDDDEDDDDSLTNFKFKTDDNLLYNKKINIPVCAVLLKKKTIIIQYLYYKNVFMKMKILKKYKLFLYKYKRGITLLIIKRTETSYQKEAIRKNMRDKYKNLLKEEKEKIKIYQINYREKMKNNISEEKRKKMKEYQKSYREKKKDLLEVFNY